MLALMLLFACDPYAHWSEPAEVYPAVFTPQADVAAYEQVRWETEDWDPQTDLAMAAQYLLKAQNHRPGAPVETVQHFEQMRPSLPPVGAGTRIGFAGDVMWVGENWDHFLDPVAHLFDGDLAVANLETPTSPLHSTDLPDLGLYAFNAPPEMLDGLPFDVLQLNNNHSLDVEDAGLEATVDEVVARGFGALGVDSHIVKEVDGRRVALLSYTWGLNRRDIQSEHELFVVPFGHLDGSLDLEPMLADVAAARDDADSVVVLVHWGFEYEYYADPHFMLIARDIVAAGADVVVGQGPHVVQPPEICHVNKPEFAPGIGTCSLRTADELPRTAAVLYSLGNFGTIMPTIQAKVGIAADVTLDPDVTGLGWTPVVTVEQETLSVRPAVDSVDPAVAAELERLQAHLGAGWRR